MSFFFGGAPDTGDWVRAERTVPVTFTDHLLGGSAGIAKGTQGVVVDRVGSRVTVAFDAHWGTQRVTVRSWDCRVVRRGGGVARFEARTRHRTAARLGFALVLMFPVLQFVVEYLWVNHSAHGLTGALAIGMVQSVLDQVTGFLVHPVRSIVYLAVVAVMSRIAFGRRG